MKKICALFEQHQKTVLPQSVGKTAPCLGQDGPSPFLPHILSGLMIAVYFVAYNIYIYIYIYIGECVSVCVAFQAYTRRRLWSNRNQIWHTHADSPV